MVRCFHPVLVLAAIAVGASGVPAHAAYTGVEHAVASLLLSEGTYTPILGAKLVDDLPAVSREIADLAAWRLEDGLQRKSEYLSDLNAWLCRALGEVRSRRYQPLLERAVAQALTSGSRRHCEQAAALARAGTDAQPFEAALFPIDAVRVEINGIAAQQPFPPDHVSNVALTESLASVIGRLRDAMPA